MLKIGLTGGIGLGKTTVSNFFLKKGMAVYDADERVHYFYNCDEEIIHKIASIAPSVKENHCINREKLTDIFLKDPLLFQKIEQIIHEKIQEDRQLFYLHHEKEKNILLNIPLLYENNIDKECDKVIVVDAPFSIQKKRVLSRKNMTEEKFLNLLKKQISNEEKVKKADYVINTSQSLKEVEIQVNLIMKDFLCAK